MATPPRPSTAEIEAALDRIRARHERLDDPRRSEMGTSPRDVLAYLQRRSPALPRALRTDDAWDELILSAALHWEELARQRGLLRRARGLGVSLSELAAHFGISTRQGMQARLDRLEALVKVGSPDVDLTRRARRADKGRAGDQRWLDAHHGEIDPLLRDLLAQVDRCRLPKSVARIPEAGCTRGRVNPPGLDGPCTGAVTTSWPGNGGGRVTRAQLVDRSGLSVVHTGCPGGPMLNGVGR